MIVLEDGMVMLENTHNNQNLLNRLMKEITKEKWSPCLVLVDLQAW